MFKMETAEVVKRIVYYFWSFNCIHSFAKNESRTHSWPRGADAAKPPWAQQSAALTLIAIYRDPAGRLAQKCFARERDGGLEALFVALRSFDPIKSSNVCLSFQPIYGISGHNVGRMAKVGNYAKGNGVICSLSSFLIWKKSYSLYWEIFWFILVSMRHPYIKGHLLYHQVWRWL